MAGHKRIGSKPAPLKTPVFFKSNASEFKKLKVDALDLLEWALDDISPDPKHRIHIKMGLEREGHFIPETFKEHALELRNNIAIIEGFVNALQYRIFDVPGRDTKLEKVCERIYREPTGAFIAEMTTKPLSPKNAAAATERISQNMTEFAASQGLKGHFGSVVMPYLQERSDTENKNSFYQIKAEVFSSKPNGSPILAGRGHHANLSIYCGKRNLFYTAMPSHDTLSDLAMFTTYTAMNTLPGMIMPCRAGNYWPIAARKGSNKFTIDYSQQTKGTAMLNQVFTDGDGTSDLDRDRVRIEFRHSAAEADPYDAALSSAIPATKTVLLHAKLDHDGKAIIDSDGSIMLNAAQASPPKVSLMPESHEEAAALFNNATNPNFTFLNDLAKHKLEQARALPEGEARIKAIMEAKKLLNIGTKLHHMYCQQYGLESQMPLECPVAALG